MAPSPSLTHLALLPVYLLSEGDPVRERRKEKGDDLGGWCMSTQIPFCSLILFPHVLYSYCSYCVVCRSDVYITVVDDMENSCMTVFQSLFPVRQQSTSNTFITRSGFFPLEWQNSVYSFNLLIFILTCLFLAVTHFQWVNITSKPYCT